MTADDGALVSIDAQPSVIPKVIVVSWPRIGTRRELSTATYMTTSRSSGCTKAPLQYLDKAPQARLAVLCRVSRRTRNRSVAKFCDVGCVYAAGVQAGRNRAGKVDEGSRRETDSQPELQQPVQGPKEYQSCGFWGP